MNTLFDFEETPQEPKPLKDWQGNEISIRKVPDSDNPMVRAHGFGPDDKKCSECKFFLRNKYHGIVYRKCIKRGLSRGKGTDHLARYESCRKFEPSEVEA